MSNKTNYTVAHRPDGWAVQRDGAERASSLHNTQAAAIAAGRPLAQQAGGELRIHVWGLAQLSHKQENRFMNDSTIIAAVIGAVATILAVLLTSKLQAQTTTRAEQAERTRNQDRENFRLAREREISLRVQLKSALKILSKIARDYSPTSMCIDRTISIEVFDRNYRESCDAFDELSATIAIYAPNLSDDVRELYGDMNNYWGNFRTVIHKEAQTKQYVQFSDAHFEQAHKISLNINSEIENLKTKIMRVVHGEASGQ